MGGGGGGKGGGGGWEEGDGVREILNNSKKSCPILYNKSLYKMGEDFLKTLNHSKCKRPELGRNTMNLKSDLFSFIRAKYDLSHHLTCLP